MSEAKNKDFNWWEGSKNVDGSKYRKGISVYACQSDTTNPKVLYLAKMVGILTEERYSEILNVPKGTKPMLDSEELRVILETYFGFYKGIFEEHEIAIQKNRFGKTVAGDIRYTGEERTDKAWAESNVASREARESSRYGGVVTMTEGDGTSELSIDDVPRGRNEDY